MPTLRVTNRLRGGFTLVELMAAMAVLAILVAMFTGFFAGASKAWNAGEEGMERRRNDRSLSDYIGNELKGALLPVQQLSTTGKGNLQFVINPPTSMVDNDSRYSDAIFWQAPAVTEATYGDIAEIGYFVKWVAPTQGATRPKLCRFFVNPSIAQGATVAPNPNFLIFDTNPTKWLSPGLLQTVAPATKESGFAGLFGENVVGLWIQAWGLDGQDLFSKTRTFDSRTGYSCNFEATDSRGSKQAWTEKRYLPARVRISIAQLDSKNVQRLDAVAGQVKDLTQNTSFKDASDFLDGVRGQAQLAPLLPGLRISSTEVQLINAR